MRIVQEGFDKDNYAEVPEKMQSPWQPRAGTWAGEGLAV